MRLGCLPNLVSAEMQRCEKDADTVRPIIEATRPALMWAMSSSEAMAKTCTNSIPLKRHDPPLPEGHSLAAHRSTLHFVGAYLDIPTFCNNHPSCNGKSETLLIT